MGRKLADLWDYAERSDKSFKCRFCLKEFRGGVVRLRSHLSGVKGGGIRLCSKVSEEAKNAAISSRNMVSKKRKTGPSSSDSDGGSSEIFDANCNIEVGYSLANFFLMAGINHKMVESSSFTSLIKALSPSSALPSSVELESKLIPAFKTEVEQYVSGAKKSWIETGCTLIPIFELNEKGGRSFLSIFGCSRERIVLLYTFEVPTNIDLVAPFLQQSVHLVVEAVGSHNIVQCVVDASQYGKYFCEFLGSKFPHVYLTKCAAREVQFMFEEIYQNVEWVSKTFTIMKLIVDYIWSDTTILALMRKYTNGKELKQSPGVNLLSSYKMLESILEVKEHLVQLVQSPEWLADSGKGQRGIEVTTYIKDPQTWKWGEEVQKGLRALSQVLCSVDFHDSGSGYLYGLMEILEHSFSQHSNNNQDMYQRLWDIYMLKKEQILTEFHSVAAFLNPAYMCTEQAKNVDWNPVISNIMERFIAEGDREDFVDEVQEYMKILSDETKLFEITAAKAYHPCQWWEKCVKKLTMLRNLAIRILSQPCSTSTCKSSMRTVEAALVKEQRELARGITDLDLKMNAVLMGRFNKDKACKREKIVLEEFSKQRSNNGESTSRPLKQLKLRFLTVIASPIRTSQNVEGENGCRIHVCLVDPATGRVVQDEIPSTLHLTITVLDGHFSNEASSDGRTGREYFNINELSGSYMTGDLKVNLIRGEGTLGTFSFNCSSGCTESGKFKLAVKTQTGDCAGFRILEGISNAFIVEDAEEVSTELPMAYVDPQNGSFSGNTGQEWFSNMWIQNESDSHSAGFGDAYINYNTFSGFNESLAQTAARRVKKKALTWKLRSRGRGVALKRGSQALGTKRRGKEVPELRRAVYSSGSNNVNQQEDGDEVNGESGASSAGTKHVGETNEVALPTHPSTALQLSFTGDEVLEPQEMKLASANDVIQQEDGEAMALKGIDSLSSTSVKLESPAIRLFGVQVAGGTTGETREGHSPTARAMPTAEDSKEITYIGVRKRPLGRYDAEIQEPGEKSRVLVGTFDTAAEAAMAYDAAARQFLGPYAKTNFPITSEPEINSTGRGNQISNEDDTPHEVEEKRFVGDNYESGSSLKSAPAKKEVKSTDTHCRTSTRQEGLSKYDVFLSFRGTDTRRGFTDLLYQHMKDVGIRVFRDEPEILSDDSIGQELINAIDSSKICILIFSRTFASSKWCLGEVERMVQKNKDVIPVFYDVTRDDVQLKTSMYTDDLARHETRYGKEQVQQWREALIKVGKLKGFELERMSLLDSINELVGLSSSKLKVKPKYELQHFVGMEDHTNKIVSLLNSESVEKQIIAIVGMGGIGKTTLAKLVFNQVSDKFDMSCFLEDVGVDSSLKTEMTRIKSFCRKKVLIVLDDIYHPMTDLFDTNWFGPGSRIIVTTRNRQCLEKMKNVFCYDMEGINAERALQLFSRKVFGLDSPPEDYQDLSKEVVSICQGHPLALTVVGTFLRGQERPYWERVITDMQKGGQSSPDELVILITTQQHSFPEDQYQEICRGHPLVLRLMSSLLNGIGKQLWESKIPKDAKSVPKDDDRVQEN